METMRIQRLDSCKGIDGVFYGEHEAEREREGARWGDERGMLVVNLV